MCQKLPNVRISAIFFPKLGFYKDSKKTPWKYMGITKIPLVLISGFYLDYKKRKTGFHRDYEKPRKMAKKVVWGFRFFFRDSWGFFRGFRFFFQDSSGFLGILRDSVIFLVISAALPLGATQSVDDQLVRGRRDLRACVTWLWCTRPFYS